MTNTKQLLLRQVDRGLVVIRFGYDMGGEYVLHKM